MNIYDFLKKFNEIDMDEIDKVNLLVKNFEEWLRINKSYETIEVFKPKEFRTIVIVHNLYEHDLCIYNSWDFIKDIIYFLEEYSDTDERYEYMFNFWNEKINKLIE